MIANCLQVGVFQLALRLCREFEEKKHWLQLGVTVSLLKQLFCFLDHMVRHGDEETNRVAKLLRRNVFYEGEVMKLLETLTKAYEPHHMPLSYMANCVEMTHAVLRQLESYGSSGERVKRRKKKTKRRKKKAEGEGGEVGENGEDRAKGGEEGMEAEGEGREEGGGEGSDGGDYGDGDVSVSIEEMEFDFEKALYDYAHQKEVISRYVSLMKQFNTLPAATMHCVVKFITRLVKQCKLEPMLFHISVLRVVCQAGPLPRAPCPAPRAPLMWRAQRRATRALNGARHVR